MSVERTPRVHIATMHRALVGQHTLRRAERNLVRCGRLPHRRAWRAPVWLTIHALPPFGLVLAAVGFVVTAATVHRIDVAGAAVVGALSALACAVWCEPWVMEAGHGFGVGAALAFLMARHADGRPLISGVGRPALQATVLVFATGGLALVAWRLRNLSVQRAVCRPDIDVVVDPSPRGPREHR